MSRAGGILVFNPGTGVFVRQTVRALQEAGLLRAFHTTLAWQPESRWGRVVGTWLPALGRQLARRSVAGLDGVSVRSWPGWELARVAASRMLKSPFLTDRVWELGERAFCRRVARRVHGGLQAVYGYDHAAYEVFRKARRLGVTTILEMPSPHHRFQRRTWVREARRTLRPGDHFYTLQRLARRRDALRDAELHLADWVVCNSQVTERSLQEAGVRPERLVRVPLGMPAAAASAPMPTSRQPVLLFAGTLSVLKGAHLLLAAWKRLRPAVGELRCFGGVDLPARFLRDLPESVRLGGSIPRGELMQQYQQADVLVFPTLCDGFGMVLTEALANGCPVLTTRHAGSADFIEPGRNGLLVEPGDLEELVRGVEWCLTHKEELHQMRPACVATAAAWQWSDYRQALATAITQRLEPGGPP